MKLIKKEITWFIIPTFIITYLIGIIGYMQGGIDKFPVSSLSMFIPGLTVIALYLIWKKKLWRGNDLGLNFRGLKYCLIAPLTIFAIVALTYTISYVVNPNIFLTGGDILEGLSNSSINKGANPYVNLALILFLNILIAPILNFPMFLGEELGWRGFLTPRLLKIMHPMYAFGLAGVIWGIWHFFGIIMGHNYPDSPIVGNILMILFCIPVGVIFQYFVLKSGSIFPAMMAHGAMNWTATTTMSFFVGDTSFNTLLWGPTGIIGIVIMWVFGLMFYRKMIRENLIYLNNNQAFALET